MAFSWSPQQLAIFAHVEAGKGSLNVIARAGSGKTVTGVEMCQPGKGSSIFLVHSTKPSPTLIATR